MSRGGRDAAAGAPPEAGVGGGVRARGLSAQVREQARALGFSLVGVARPDASDHMAFYREWIAQGRHGEMGYLARTDAVERRADLRRTMESVRSVVVVAHEYYQEDPPGVPEDPSRGVIARYARGRDYHKVVKKKLKALGQWLEAAAAEVAEASPGSGAPGGAEANGGASAGWRAYVDTGPILERDLARRAGIGWHGKNTMLLNPRRGSYFFLGVLLTDVALEPDEPFTADHCGSCRACLDACPTGALLGRDESGAPVMDATRCISYLTIEHRGAIPVELRPLIGNRVYGCDICQEVCPFNVKFAEETAEPGYAARGQGERPAGVEAVPGVEALPGGRGGRGVSAETPEDVSAETRGFGNPAHPGTHVPSLVELMRMTRDEWDAFSRGSAIRRAGYACFKRNVAVAMGNWLAGLEGEPPEEAIAVLRAAAEDESELVREHAAWALGRANR